MAVTSNENDVEAYRTKDGSIIRELMHPAVHGNINQSLAQATVAPGELTQLHRHRHSEEIYHVTAGQGRLTLETETIDVGPGDSVCIPPGIPHRIENTGAAPLVFLCCSAPAYSHEDTELLD